MGEGVLYPGEGLVKRKIDKYYGVRPLRVATVKPHYGHLDLNWRNHFKDLLKDSTQLSLLACFHALWPPVPLGSQYAGCKHIICWHGVDAGGMFVCNKNRWWYQAQKMKGKAFLHKRIEQIVVHLDRPLSAQRAASLSSPLVLRWWRTDSPLEQGSHCFATVNKTKQNKTHFSFNVFTKDWAKTVTLKAICLDVIT